MSYFLTLEGIEGVGKTTLARGLSDWLCSLSFSVISTREPGGSTLGRALRALLLETESLPPLAELCLFAADRAVHVSETIKPALQSGSIVVCDRFLDSTIAYQGYGRGISLDALQSLNKLVAQGCVPTLTFLLDAEPETGLLRAKRRGCPKEWTRFEQEEQTFHQKVRSGFLAIAAEESARVAVLDASKSPEEVLAQAKEILLTRTRLTSCPNPD